MPDNPSNRERLLRLIDGGTEALKEMHTDEPAGPKPVKSPTLFLDHTTRLLIDWKKKLPVLSAKDLTRLAQGLLVLAAIVAALHYGSEMLKTLKHPADKVASTEGVSATTEESETGLRLVGVDTSDTSPVALLEDLKTGKTYFAHLNEQVKGARVKQIQKKKVTVTVHGKTVELR